MPIHTRSTTKRLLELENGCHAFISLSETGEGIHTHFEYGDCHSPDLSSKALLGLPTGGSSFSSDYSATPTLTSSLSSISSGSSSNQSINVANGSNCRPLQRSSAYHWVEHSETGELRVMLPSSGQCKQADEDDIFEREYQTAMKNRDYMVDLTKKLVAMEELNEDIAYDTLQMFIAAKRPSVEEEAPQVTSRLSKKPLGPEGTELVDETFRAPPGELGVYPQRWVTHQSTLLQSQHSYAFMPYAL